MPENGGIDRIMIQGLLPDLDQLRPSLLGLGSQAQLIQRLETCERTVRLIYDYLEQQRLHLQNSYDLLAERINEKPEMIWLSFFQDNVSAGQTSVALSDGMTTRGLCAPEEGSIVAIAVRSNAARSAGTLTVDGTVNGTASGLQAVLDGTNTTTHDALQDQGKDTFSRGDAIGCDITTSADWAPTTADVIISVGVVPARGVR